jgi:Spy/CpxP family protein refolding chaperone
MLRKFTATLLVAFTIAIIAVSSVDARGRGHRRPGHRGGNISFSRALSRLDLTEAQRTEVDAKIAELREAGATKTEIREAVVQLLEGFGVEVPPFLKGRVERLLSELDLTDEQRIAIDEKVAELREAGATKSEIREAISQLLDEFGVEVPDDLFDRRGPRRRFGFFLRDLTDEQRTEIQETVAELREAGATRREIREAVKELLVEFGIIEGADAGDDDAAADLAVVDAEIQAAPATSASIRLRNTTWGAIKTGR